MEKSRIFERVFVRLLREALDLGDVEFSPSRVDGARRNEPDTAEEALLAKDVKRWLDAAAATPDFSRKLKELMSHPKYGRFFHPPEPGSVLYRGNTMSPADLALLIGAREGELKAAGSATGKFSMPIRKGVASWTYERSIADEFANRPNSQTKPGHVGVVLSARADENPDGFIDMHDMVRRVLQWRPYDREAEVLALGPGSTRVYHVEWAPMRDIEPEDGENMRESTAPDPFSPKRVDEAASMGPAYAKAESVRQKIQDIIEMSVRSGAIGDQAQLNDWWGAVESDSARLRGMQGEFLKSDPQPAGSKEFVDMVLDAAGEAETPRDLAQWWGMVSMAMGALKGVPFEVWAKKSGRSAAGSIHERVLRRLLREASAGGAFWITPEGDRIDVPPGETHDAAAARAMGIEFDPEEWEYGITPSDMYIDRGAVKARSYSSAHLDALAVSARDRSPSTLERVALAARGERSGRRLTVTTVRPSFSEEDTTVGRFLSEI